MEENRNTENEKSKAKNTKEKNFANFLSVHKNEFKKIVWPSKDELLKQTGTVIVVSLIVGAIIFAYDSAISFTYEKTINMIKGSEANVVTETNNEGETSAVSSGLTVGGETNGEETDSSEDLTETSENNEENSENTSESTEENSEAAETTEKQ